MRETSADKDRRMFGFSSERDNATVALSKKQVKDDWRFRFSRCNGRPLCNDNDDYHSSEWIHSTTDKTKNLEQYRLPVSDILTIDSSLVTEFYI